MIKSQEPAFTASAFNVLSSVNCGCATTARRDGVKQRISDSQLSMSDAGTIRSEGRTRSPPVLCVIPSRQAPEWFYPSPISSARHAPKPSSRRNASQLRPGLLIRPQASAEALRPTYGLKRSRRTQITQHRSSQSPQIISPAHGASHKRRVLHTQQQTHGLGKGDLQFPAQLPRLAKQFKVLPKRLAVNNGPFALDQRQAVIVRQESAGLLRKKSSRHRYVAAACSSAAPVR